jgi:hypothetical protein
MIERWCISTVESDGRPRVALYARAFDHRMEIGARVLCRAEFEGDEVQLEAAQADAQVLVLPSKAAPADRLPQNIQSWLAADGVVLEPGDTVLNVLRKVRARFGLRFNVSQRE